MNEVPPPWVMHPGFSPADTFWRQSGEIWLENVWHPFWQSLSQEAKDEYLLRWEVPDIWRQFYFDPDFQALLEDE